MHRNQLCYPAWKVSKFWVFLVRIFPYSDWIRRWSKSPYSVWMRENMHQKNSEYRNFSESIIVQEYRNTLFQFLRIIRPHIRTSASLDPLIVLGMIPPLLISIYLAYKFLVICLRKLLWLLSNASKDGFAKQFLDVKNVHLL